MSDILRAIGITRPVDPLSFDRATVAKPEVSFGKLFETAVDRVEHLQTVTDDKLDRFLRGEDQDVHDVVLAGQRAELAFDYFLQVRNKVVQAYQEVMRMQM
jgi:flagellar hook-basal body complex protein FliE